MAHILLIDHNTEIRGMLKQTLRPLDHVIHTAANGASGMDLLLRKPVDLIIIDMSPQETHGFEFISQLHHERHEHSHGYEHLKLLAMITTATDWDERMIIRTVRKIGVDDVMHKPFTSLEVHAKVTALLGNFNPNLAQPLLRQRRQHATIGRHVGRASFFPIAMDFFGIVNRSLGRSIG